MERSKEVRAALSKIIDEQVQKLLSLIKTPKDNNECLSGKCDWLLDSGASYHMIGDLRLLINVSNIMPIPMGLPNGVIMFASKRSIVRLGPKLTLNDVLFVRDLMCNLISIAQLVEDLYCTVMFNHKLCIIQDLTTKMAIGIGEHRKGVYFYKGDATAKVQVNKVLTYDLWHRRMGHPSNQALSNLSSIVSRITNNHKKGLCELC